MKAVYAGNTLADDAFPIVESSINGQRVVQESQPIRAAYVSLFARGLKKSQISFTVQRSFATVVAAQSFMLVENQTLPDSGALVLTLGANGETEQDATIAAKLLSVDLKYKGVATYVTYTFLYASVSALTATPETVERVVSGTFDIPDGVDNATITGLALGVVPQRVIVSVSVDAGVSDVIAVLHAIVITPTITADGFKFFLNSPTDSGNYKLDYEIFI